MKRKLIFIFICILVGMCLATSIAHATLAAGDSAILAFSFPKEEAADLRVIKLQAYLENHHSPLAPYAHIFIERADYYELPDWKLVPAITGVESTFGKHIPYNSYNAYGWANGNYAFENWETSIDIVSKTLKKKYYEKGADTVEKIARIYAPPSTTWARNVQFFMNKIELFEPSLSEDDLTLSL